MTPYDFTAKWRDPQLKERTASQSHFNDLCALLEVADPITADRAGDWYTFEKGATKTNGDKGWADVWKRECFAWEYKGPKKDLTQAFAQLQRYSVALENPPLLIVSDMNRIRLHTNWTNTVQEVREWTLDDLIDGDQRAKLKQAFVYPDAFKPATTRQALTEETAREFAALAQRLRERKHDAFKVAHFINQLVFCMFAQNTDLLRDKLFTRMLERSRLKPASFTDNAEKLFGAMAKGGDVGFESVDWFNGGLFDDDYALPLTSNDLDDLLKAAKRDWSAIDPAILGTLFERGLDPAKRSQLGAHYTDRAKIDMIVQPLIIKPLEAEWAAARAQIVAVIEEAPQRTAERLLSTYERGKRTQLFSAAKIIHEAFIERLAAFRVLDPACGSGNFLYVALKALKDLEHRANLDAEALGLERGFPRVGPENVLGIELNPYAAELARISVWFGEIQWMRRNGFDAAKNPILRPLETIECRDAVLNEDGTRAEWPKADVVIGNPPFLGGKRMRDALGSGYVDALFAAHSGRVPQEADLVTYWVAKGWAAATSGRAHRVGLVTTNSIRGGANRRVLTPIADAHGFFDAWSDQPWTVDGAAVRVSLLAFAAKPAVAPMLDGQLVERINADLTGAASDLTKAVRLGQNGGVAFMGDTKGGAFEVPGLVARDWLTLPLNPNGQSNADVLRPWVNGMDVTRRPSDKWIVDYGWAMSEGEASLYEAPFRHLILSVQPVRASNKRNTYARFWWRHVEARQGMWKRLGGLRRYVATPTVAKHRLFVWLESTICPDHQLIAIARDDDTSFGVLHSCFHELWSLRMGTSLEDRPRYTPSTTFETFPFPEGLTPDIPAAAYADDPRAQAIAAAAARLNKLRESGRNPADLVLRETEVVPGYPDRILPVDADAAKELKKRTLTNLYNTRPAWLANAHAALDAAVADAYGWGDAWRAGMSDDDILARLFALNQECNGASPGSFFVQE